MHIKGSERLKPVLILMVLSWTVFLLFWVQEGLFGFNYLYLSCTILYYVLPGAEGNVAHIIMFSVTL